jgi:hypothetical protein
MKKLLSLIRRCTGQLKKEEIDAHIVMKTLPSGKALTVYTSAEESFIRVQDLNRRSATILEFKSTRRWPAGAWERLVEDLTASGPLQTNANIFKFPRYRRQYKSGLRPGTRRRQ